MNTYVSVVYYKHKTLTNGEHPLMLRITKDRKSKYQSLGISIHPDFWDFEKNQPKRNCPNRDAILRLITEKTKIRCLTISADLVRKSIPFVLPLNRI